MGQLCSVKLVHFTPIVLRGTYYISAAKSATKIVLPSRYRIDLSKNVWFCIYLNNNYTRKIISKCCQFDKIWGIAPQHKQDMWF